MPPASCSASIHLFWCAISRSVHESLEVGGVCGIEDALAFRQDSSACPWGVRFAEGSIMVENSRSSCY